MKRKLALWGALAVALCPVLSPAQSGYPNRSVKIIVPFAPGGASDFVARIMQPRLSELLGQPIVIENRGGAAGTIGMEVAARSAPDGYTLVLGNVGSTAINPGVFTNLSYVKANPGKLNYASPGSGSQNRLEMEILRTAEGGMEMVHVPYKGGAGPAVTGLVAGETQMMFSTVSSAMGHIKGGRLKALAITSPKHHEDARCHRAPRERRGRGGDQQLAQRVRGFRRGREFQKQILREACPRAKRRAQNDKLA